jgi:DNA-damage-inducible protein D
MSQELVDLPAYQSTMERLESVKRASAEGEDYWLAREINELLGYPGWREFEAVVERARSSFTKNGIEPSHQIVLTHKMMEVGKGAQRQGDDYFLSRAACYLIAMNGDPSKPEIAAAQAYFAIKTRQMEILEQSEREHPDVRRVAARERVTHSFRRVSGAAKDAGVQRQGLFHDARYQGLYGGRGTREVKRLKGLNEKDNLFDFAGALELSAHEFQMNLAADVLGKENVRGEQQAITTNRRVGEHVRTTIKNSGGTLPEVLKLEEPIKNVTKRLKAPTALPKSNDSST